jgi:hypothetical protein
MAATVASKKGDAFAFEKSGYDGFGWITEWSLDANLFCIREAFHRIQAASADDSNIRLRIFSRSLRLRFFQGRCSLSFWELPVEVYKFECNLIFPLMQRRSGNVRVVAENDDPAVLDDGAHPFSLGFERLQRVKVVGHDPG